MSERIDIRFRDGQILRANDLNTIVEAVNGIEEAKGHIYDETKDSLAEGSDSSISARNIALGIRSHAEGSGTEARGYNSHAEGDGSFAIGGSSHAEGDGSIANGMASHAEGENTSALGIAAHAEGSNTIAYSASSHAEGIGTITTLGNDAEHAEGKYNVSHGGTPTPIPTEVRITHLDDETDAQKQDGIAHKHLPIALDGLTTRNSLTQQLYMQNEIGEAKTITGIKFDYYYTDATHNTEPTRNIEVWLMHSNITVFGTTFETIVDPEDPLHRKRIAGTKVFDGSVTLTENEYTITFDTPFDYDGESNLIITVCDKTGGTGGTNRHRTDKYQTGVYKSLKKLVSTINTDWDMSDLLNVTGVQENYRARITILGNTYTNSESTIHSIGIGTGSNDRMNAVEVMSDGSVYVKGIGNYDGTDTDNAITLQDVVNSSTASVIDDSSVYLNKTFSSKKITSMIGNITSFDVSVLDELPKIGKEHTLYFTPSKEDTVGVYNSASCTYVKGDSSTRIDSIPSSIGGQFGDLEIGDVFEYVEDSNNVPEYIYRQVVSSTGSGGTTVYRATNVGTTVSQMYPVGTTFKVGSAPSNSYVFASVSDPSIDSSGNLGGSTSRLAVTSDHTYRLTGYYRATYTDDVVDVIDADVDSVYYVTYEEVYDVSTPDYDNFTNLYSLQIRTAPKVYTVPSAIDKDNIVVEQTYPISVLYSNNYQYTKKCLRDGVTSTLTLTDGHYYKLIDRYFAKSDQFYGGLALYATYSNYGYEILVFEEVNNPSVVKYDNITFVPSWLAYTNHIYNTYPKQCFPIVKNSSDQYIYDYSRTQANNEQFDVTIGKIYKVTENNTPINTYSCVVVTDVNDSSLSYNDSTGEISGITDSSVWAKDEYYKFNGYYYIGDIVRELELYVAVFEKVTITDEPYEEIERIPGVIMRRERSSVNIRNEWMWVNDDWELIGTTEIDLSDYVTTSQMQSSLLTKQDTISDLATIRSGAALGATALQSVPSEYITESELEPITYTISSHINGLTERVGDVEDLQDISVQDVIDELEAAEPEVNE